VTFEKNGIYVVRARAHVRVPPGRGREPATRPATAVEQLVESAPAHGADPRAPDAELLSFAQDPRAQPRRPGRRDRGRVGFRDAAGRREPRADNFQSPRWLSADGDLAAGARASLSQNGARRHRTSESARRLLKQSNPELAPASGASRSRIRR